MDEELKQSIAKILQRYGAQLPNTQELITAWIQTLPVTNDEEAAPYAYMYLATLIDQYVPSLSVSRSA